jgi:hypothetical protein
MVCQLQRQFFQSQNSVSAFGRSITKGAYRRYASNMALPMEMPLMENRDIA